MRSFVLLLALFAPCLGVEPVSKPKYGEDRTVESNQLVDFTLEKPSAVIVQEPLGLDYRVYNLESGTPVIVFYSGTHTRVVFLTFANGEVVPEVTQWFFTVRNAPEPGPKPPKPPKPLTGFAATVAERAASVDLSAADRLKAAEDFESIASMVAAGAIKKIEGAIEELGRRQGSFWPKKAEPFVRWLEKEINERVTNLEVLVDVFTDIGKGLRNE